MNVHSYADSEADRVQARRRQILTAATEVFAAKGFERSTIREIARRAGVADGTIYNYFRTKADLLFGLLDQLNETEDRPAMLGGMGEGDLRSALEALVLHRLEHVGRELPLIKALLPELLFDETLRARYRDDILGPTMAMAQAAFEQLTAAGALRANDPALSVRLVAGMVFGVLMLGALGDPVAAERRAELPRAIVALMLDGLGAQGGTP